jgi:hypothetical protein
MTELFSNSRKIVFIFSINHYLLQLHKCKQLGSKYTPKEPMNYDLTITSNDSARLRLHCPTTVYDSPLYTLIWLLTSQI